ncbi:hypothetical protein F4804DRAFT_341418 [Jackrogersella minutella]|nr:hypothetical protein F4804DRAFT_341418 [Jackrogersella minutella]
MPSPPMHAHRTWWPEESVTAPVKNKMQTWDNSHSGTNLEDQLIQEYKLAEDEDDVEQASVVSEKIVDLLVQAGESTFKKLSIATPSGDLHSLVFPPKLYCSLATVEGKVQVIEQPDPYLGASEYDRHFEDEDHQFSLRNIGQVQGLTRYSTKVIRVLERLRGNGYVVRVLIDQREYCVKVYDYSSYRAVQRELHCLHKIATSRYAATLRTPKLIGFVESADDGHTIGIVEEYIPHAETYEMSTLAYIEDIATIDMGRRKKWSSQIRTAIAQLHEIGVIWGDAKPSNILIQSETDDIYLIDFGGGYTSGWGTKETMETIEGDIQALEKIEEYLQVELNS